MRTRPHAHPCAKCGVRTECCGTIEQNYDGEPPFICVEYHLPNGSIAEFLCETCAELPEEPEGEAWSGGFAKNH